MKYFLHDTSAFEDEKIIELYKNFGYTGVGLWYVFLEKIGKQEKPIKTDVLKFQLKVGKKLNKCWNFMEEIGLICSTNGESFNNNLLNFSESYKIKKEKTRNKVAEWRENQKNKKNVTSYETVSNPPKVKESKVKERKVNTSKPITIIPNTNLIFPFNTEKFLEVWNVLKNEPNWKKKSDNAYQLSLNKLGKYSEITAIEMMEKCIEAGWKGLVEPKESKKPINAITAETPKEYDTTKKSFK